MADVIGPRVPPVPGRLYGQDRRRTQEQIRQLQRPRVKLPRAAGSGSGGIVGSLQITSTPGSVVQNGTGARIDEGAVTYGAPVDPHAGTGGAGATGWLSVTNNEITLDAGWYSLALTIDAAWATPANAPDYCGVYIAGVPNEIAEYVLHPAVTTGSRKGFRLQIVTPPFYAGFGSLWCEVEFGAHSGTSDALVGLAGSSDASHVWTFVRYG